LWASPVAKWRHNRKIIVRNVGSMKRWGGFRSWPWLLPLALASEGPGTRRWHWHLGTRRPSHQLDTVARRDQNAVYAPRPASRFDVLSLWGRLDLAEMLQS
jgi:hypothetical protein